MPDTHTKWIMIKIIIPPVYTGGCRAKYLQSNPAFDYPERIYCQTQNQEIEKKRDKLYPAGLYGMLIDAVIICINIRIPGIIEAGNYW